MATTPHGDSLPSQPPVVDIDTTLFGDEQALRALEQALPSAIVGRRWFGAKSRTIAALSIFDVLKVPGVRGARLLLTTVSYNEGEPDTYLLPVREVDEVTDETSVLVHLRFASGRQIALIDACHDVDTALALLDAIDERSELPGTRGLARGVRTDSFAEGRGDGVLTPALWRREGSNSSIVYGDRLMLKLFRRPEIGLNPDWELGRFLTDESHFTHVPPTAGALEYEDAEGNTRTLGLLQQLVSNQGDARQRFFAELRGFFAAVTASELAVEDFAEVRGEASLGREAAPPLARQMLGDALEMAELLGRRTAEMHLAFAAATGSELAATPFTPDYQRSLSSSTREQLQLVLAMLERHLPSLDATSALSAGKLLALGDAVYERLDAMHNLNIRALRMRVHGDYHLEQVLVQDGDFIILDFEGEPSASLAERRIKRSPLKDVAGMLRSFDYAARPVLNELPLDASGRLSAACTYWTMWVGGAFLEGYLVAGGELLLPEGREASEALLRNFLLEKAAYEVQYELNNRPSWVGIPLRGILDQLT